MTKSRDLANFATAGAAVSATELGFVDGVTSAIQTQIDTKLATATAATTYIAKSLPTAKGDILTATASGTPAVLPVSTQNGDTIVADSAATTGLRYTANFAAGKNKVNNGDFAVWQRGTSFTLVGVETYTADRFLISSGGGGTCVVTRQSFTPGQTDVPNANYFLQVAYSVAGTTPSQIQQRIEDVNTFAGQTVTFSFYAKVNTGTQSLTPRIVQDFGSGGSSLVVTNLTNQTLTTSWQRFSATVTIPSISGKTVGTSSYLRVDLSGSNSGTLTYSFANLQLEASNTATAFQTATGTIQGELAACQRYYYRSIVYAGYTYTRFGIGAAANATTAYPIVVLPVTLRTQPTSIEYSNLGLADGGAPIAITALSIDQSNPNVMSLSATVASGLTTYRPYSLLANNSANAYLAFVAEL